jgi:DNA-binding IscR family transcriptional regulator
VPPEEGLHDAEGADSDPLSCPIRDAWHLATATMRRILDGMTLEVLVQRQREIEDKRAAGAAVKGATDGPDDAGVARAVSSPA